MVILGICILIGLVFVASSICYVGNVIEKAFHDTELHAVHMLALDRIRLRIELAEMGFEIPQWLLDGFDEEDDKTEDKLKEGKILKLVRKEKKKEIQKTEENPEEGAEENEDEDLEKP